MANILFEGDTEFQHYIVADTIYAGRPARVLYSGHYTAAQSGVARDDKPDMLFDYNERFMELMRGAIPGTVLLLGGGAFSLPKALSDEFPTTNLDIVELDKGLPEIASTYFDYHPSARTHVYIGDGVEYLRDTAQKYDLILIDIFSNTNVPTSIQTRKFAKILKRTLAQHGIVAINLIASYYGDRSSVLRRQIDSFQHAFSNLELFPASHVESLWLPQNFILTASLHTKKTAPSLRYKSLPLP